MKYLMLVLILFPFTIMNAYGIDYESVQIPSYPREMKINEKTNEIFILSIDKITIVDGESFNIKQVDIDHGASSIELNSEKNLIYLTYDNTQSIITKDGTSFEVIKTTSLNLDEFQDVQLHPITYDYEKKILIIKIYGWIDDKRNSGGPPDYTGILTVNENDEIQRMEQSKEKFEMLLSTYEEIEGGKVYSGRGDKIIVRNYETNETIKTYDVPKDILETKLSLRAFEKITGKEIFFSVYDQRYDEKKKLPLKTAGKLVVFDGEKNNIKEFAVGNGPMGAIFNENLNQLIIVNRESLGISIFDVETSEIKINVFSYRQEIGLLIFGISIVGFLLISKYKKFTFTDIQNKKNVEKISKKGKILGILTISGIYFPVVFDEFIYIGNSMFWLKITSNISIPIWGPIIYIPLMFSLTVIVLVLIKSKNMQNGIADICYRKPKKILENGIYFHGHTKSDFTGFVITCVIVVFSLSYVLSTIPASAAVSIIPGSSFIEHFTSIPSDVSSQAQKTASQYITIGPYGYVMIPLVAVLWVFAIRHIRLSEEGEEEKKKFKGSRSLLIFLYLTILLFTVTYTTETNPYDKNSEISNEKNSKNITNAFVKALYIGIPAGIILYSIEKSIKTRIQEKMLEKSD